MSVDFAPHDLGVVTVAASHAPYVVSASTYHGSFPFTFAFDGTTGNYWLGTNSGVDWLQIQIGSGDQVIVDQYQIQVNVIPEPARAPKNFTLKGSNDGSTWTTLDTRTNETGWTSGEIRTYTVTGAASYSYYRLDITANNGDATYTQVAEFYIYTSSQLPTDVAPHNMTTNSLPTPYVASASSVFAGVSTYYAFDGLPGAGNSWVGTNAGVDWLKIDLGASASYKLKAYTVSGAASAANRSPKNWTMEGSNNNSTWTTLDTQTNQTSWGTAPEKRNFIVNNTTAYRYFRLNISANNGDATYVDVSELYIWSGGAGGGGGGGGAKVSAAIIF